MPPKRRRIRVSAEKTTRVPISRAFREEGLFLAIAWFVLRYSFHCCGTVCAVTAATSRRRYSGWHAVESEDHFSRGAKSRAAPVFFSRQTDFDYLAVYVIPKDIWYIMPWGKVTAKIGIRVCPGAKANPYERYREAWHLLHDGFSPPPQKHGTCNIYGIIEESVGRGRARSR